MKNITIYTDGSCDYADGSGGVGAILMCDGYPTKEIKAGFQCTTTGRMEIAAVIMALSALKRPASALVHCDAQYVVNSISKGWAASWRAHGWRKPSGAGTRRINADLWEIVLTLCSVHQVTMQWVRGHSDCLENDRCHELANEARKAGPWTIDEKCFVGSLRSERS